MSVPCDSQSHSYRGEDVLPPFFLGELVVTLGEPWKIEPVPADGGVGGRAEV